MCGKVDPNRVRVEYDNNGYVLTRNGEKLKRQRQFRKAKWNTWGGAYRAATKLNNAAKAA